MVSLIFHFERLPSVYTRLAGTSPSHFWQCEFAILQALDECRTTQARPNPGARWNYTLYSSSIWARPEVKILQSHHQDRLASLVAYQSEAEVEAALRGLGRDAGERFREKPQR